MEFMVLQKILVEFRGSVAVWKGHDGRGFGGGTRHCALQAGRVQAGDRFLTIGIEIP